MRCYRRIFKVCWRVGIGNETIREEVERRRRCTIVDLIKHRKLKLFGHICMMTDERIVKTVMLGMVEGDRPCGKPAKRWSDDVIDWCGGTLPEAVQLPSEVTV